MSGSRQFRQDAQIPHGTDAQANLKMTDIFPVQHENLETNTNQMKKISIGQCLCEPYAVCNSNNPSNGRYKADCINFPDFALSFTDGQGTSHALVGLKVRVLFTHGITYGSVSDNTYPTLNINNSGAIPLLAQGKTMGAGAISAGQTVEFTVIPYGNGLAFDADSNVREANSDCVIYTDGLMTYRYGEKLKLVVKDDANLCYPDLEFMQPFIVKGGANKHLPNDFDGFAIICFRSFNSDTAYDRYKQIAFDMFYSDRNYVRYGYQTGAGYTWGQWENI